MENKFADRLPQIIVPKHYELRLIPEMKDKIFSGSVEITFEKKDDSQTIPNEILLHAHDPLVIDNVSCNDFPLKFEQASNILTIHEFQDLSQPISILFHGIINDGSSGFTYGIFTSNNILATQFEPNYASTVFPCFDEPCIRSTFNISIVSSLSEEVFSNMPLASSRNQGTSKISEFQTTPPIPAYLVSFVIGAFDSIHSYSKSGVPIDVYGHLESCDAVLPLAIEGIDFMEEYTQIKYPLPRLQIVIVPGFVLGGMENHGLIILNHYGNTSEDYVPVVYHEIAHHWAGNLATIKWWDSLWVPEGLATFFPFLLLEKKYEKSFQNEIISCHLQSALLKDSSPNVLPLKSCSQTESDFNVITYYKSLLLLNSSRNWYGNDDFQKSLQIFQKKRSHFSMLLSLSLDILSPY